MNDLFNQLENYRITNQLTVTKLVELVGIGRTTYYEWKNGKPPAKIEVYKKVEQFLNCQEISIQVNKKWKKGDELIKIEEKELSKNIKELNNEELIKWLKHLITDPTYHVIAEEDSN